MNDRQTVLRDLFARDNVFENSWLRQLLDDLLERVTALEAGVVSKGNPGDKKVPDEVKEKVKKLVADCYVFEPRPDEETAIDWDSVKTWNELRDVEKRAFEPIFDCIIEAISESDQVEYDFTEFEAFGNLTKLPAQMN